METYRISESELGYVNVILYLLGERRCRLCLNKCLITQVAEELGLDPDHINVYFEDYLIDKELTPEDCCIISDSRLTVVKRIIGPIITGHYNYTPTREEKAKQDEQANQEAPLRRTYTPAGNNNTSGFITVFYKDEETCVFVEEYREYHTRKKIFTYYREIRNISSKHPLDTDGIESDPGLIKFLDRPNCDSKSLKKHEEKYVLTLVR